MIKQQDKMRDHRWSMFRPCRAGLLVLVILVTLTPYISEARHTEKIRTKRQVSDNNVCEDTFNVFNCKRPNTVEGTKIDANTEEDCRQLCLEDMGCEAFDFRKTKDEGKRCYHYKVYIPEDELRTAKREKHYRRVRCPSLTVPTLALTSYGATDTAHLECASGQVIVLERVRYGSTNSNCQTTNAFLVAMSECFKRTTCMLNATMFQDNCTAQENRLDIAYRCIERRRVVDVCEQHTVSESFLYVHSPNYPNNYGGNMDCTTEVKTFNKGNTYHFIDINTEAIETRDFHGCYDKVFVQQAGDVGTLSTHCGTFVHNEDFMAGDMSIRMTTDSDTHFRGFLMRIGSIGLNDCLLSNQECNHMCINDVGSHHCVCYDGFMIGSDGKTCSDIDECQVPTHGCEQRCVNSWGYYHCECYNGFREVYVGLKKTCVDINECDMGYNSCQHSCINDEGSYHCECQNGFVLQSDGLSCYNEQDTSSTTVASTPTTTLSSSTTTVASSSPPATGGDCNTGPTCISSCVGVANGEYQSCDSCVVYHSCQDGLIQAKRPCHPLGLVWNDDKRYCDWSSPTCTEPALGSCKPAY